jgi:hypothetical protein
MLESKTYSLFTIIQTIRSIYMKKIMAVLVMAMMPMIAGCGGGGDSALPLLMPTAATVKVSSQGTMPAGKAVSGIAVTIELPTGATAKNTGGVVDATVVVGSSLMATTGATPVGSMGPVYYTPATATAKAKLDFTIASTVAAGVAVGEYATITLILSGVNPAVTDFTVTSFKAYDMNFAEITALTSKLALTVN